MKQIECSLHVLYFTYLTLALLPNPVYTKAITKLMHTDYKLNCHIPEEQPCKG